ncbi:MAG: sigma-70 family RNA polymerase sigma factor [Myxococcota bacterium]|nr:sigma-70 family RNA polymerase sigma factor [Myxococcota bacterium]
MASEYSYSGSQKSRQSFEQLYGRYSRMLLAHCTKILCDDIEAEDALQETFIRVNRSLPMFVQKNGYRGWLLRIATNICINKLRAEKGKPVVLTEDVDWIADEIEDTVRVLAARQTLKKIMDLLNEREVIFVIKHFIIGIDQAELAQEYGITWRAVAKRLRRIRDRINHLCLENNQSI